MTEQDKQLLLKDLCARLPYRVKVGFENSNVILTIKEYCCFTQQLFTNLVLPEHNGHIEYGCQFYEYRPYLRPMSSMTDEEENEYRAINCYEGLFPCNEEALDYVLEHHLDFRNLIGKGLALEAKEGMYKNEC